MWASVLGSPIAHSLSPVLHRAAYSHLGLSDWSYTAQECTAPQLPGFVERARRDPAFAGYSLTMPLKVTALDLLDALEPLAASVQAVNTVVPRGGGLFGANTDVPGLVNALREAGVGLPQRAVVLGGGGSAQAAVAALAELGASRVRVVLRSSHRAAALVAVAERVGIALEPLGWNAASVADADLVINTVPAAASEEIAGWIGAAAAGFVLFDLIYSPWPTPLAGAALQAGARVLGGLDLLVHQAVGQVELMTGRVVEVSILRAAGQAALAARSADSP